VLDQSLFQTVHDDLATGGRAGRGRDPGRGLVSPPTPRFRHVRYKTAARPLGRPQSRVITSAMGQVFKALREKPGGGGAESLKGFRVHAILSF